MDAGDELPGFGLQGLRVSEDELEQLVAELGLDGDDAQDLVKGLSESSADRETPKTDAVSASSPTEEAAKEK